MGIFPIRGWITRTQNGDYMQEIESEPKMRENLRQLFVDEATVRSAEERSANVSVSGGVKC
jgi:hypothetical protein